MSNLKQLRLRIKAIRSTQKITKAMKLIAANRLKKIRKIFTRPNYYQQVIDNITQRMTYEKFELYDIEKCFFAKDFFSGIQQPISPINNINLDFSAEQLLIIITSDRGLCGGFNQNLLKKIKADINILTKNQIKFKLIVIGKKGYDALEKLYKEQIISYYSNVLSSELALPTPLKNEIIELVSSNKVEIVKIYFNEFSNSLSANIKVENLIPIIPRIANYTTYKIPLQNQQVTSINLQDASNTTNHIIQPYEFIYEGDNFILTFINLYLHSQLYRAILNNNASEHQARMIAMDNATKNANELVEQLTLKMNRSRQSNITNELTEIISGANSV